MKRAVILSVAVVMVVMIVAIVVARWLLRTTDGARWALRSFSAHTPLKVLAVKLEGRLLDHLRLEGVGFKPVKKRPRLII